MKYLNSKSRPSFRILNHPLSSMQMGIAPLQHVQLLSNLYSEQCCYDISIFYINLTCTLALYIYPAKPNAHHTYEEEGVNREGCTYAVYMRGHRDNIGDESTRKKLKKKRKSTQAHNTQAPCMGRNITSFSGTSGICWRPPITAWLPGSVLTSTSTQAHCD